VHLAIFVVIDSYWPLIAHVTNISSHFGYRALLSALLLVFNSDFFNVFAK